MTLATATFPPELFVEHLLVTIRDSDERIPGSVVPFNEHARQAAALADRDGLAPGTVAAALLYGFGNIVARSWARHPSNEATMLEPHLAASRHLSLHLPDIVTSPIALLAAARRYMAAHSGHGLNVGPLIDDFETDIYAPAALELHQIDRRAGCGPMITPGLDHYRGLLIDLCAQTESRLKGAEAMGSFPPLALI